MLNILWKCIGKSDKTATVEYIFTALRKEVTAMGLFKKRQKEQKPSCIAFVDFEHWYISLDKFYSVKPDIKAWASELSEKYDVKEIAVFADFSNTALRAELDRLRDVTGFIFDTKNSSEHYKKDFTDFILLDYIYRKTITQKDIDTFIIFTGDGHFTSVVRFIINECHRNVGIYGISGATNAQLKASATWSVEIPSDTEVYKQYYRMVVENFNYLTVHREFGEMSTKAKIIERTASKNGISKKALTGAVDRMISAGYIYQSTYTDGNGKKFQVLKPNWELLSRDKLWIQP